MIDSNWAGDAMRQSFGMAQNDYERMREGMVQEKENTQTLRGAARASSRFQDYKERYKLKVARGIPPQQAQEEAEREVYNFHRNVDPPYVLVEKTKKNKVRTFPCGWRRV